MNVEILNIEDINQKERELISSMGQGIAVETKYATALKRASYLLGKTDIVDFIISRERADVAVSNNAPLILASSAGNIDVVNLLIENKADPKAQNSLAFILACKNGHKNIAEKLADCGADIEAEGNIALILAEKNQHKEIVDLIKNKLNYTPEFNYSNEQEILGIGR